jgi:S-formylglutathione hydrolase FrmB
MWAGQGDLSMSRSMLRGLGCAVALSALLIAAPAAYAAATGKVVETTVHGVSLENTVSKESPDRAVSIYLPPSYDSSSKRYPVVYLLHGVGGTDKDWTEDGDWHSIKSLMDHGIAEGRIREMIVVMPNEHTNMFGSFYTNSSVTGRWEDFTARELVAYVDRTYRTLKKQGARGIAGHSMGGYGALRLGMKNADVYSVVYGMSPASPGWTADLRSNNPDYIEATKARSMADLKPPSYVAGIVNLAQAFSPNPTKAPLYVDLPYAEVDGKVVPAEPAFSSWEANFLPNMVARNAKGLASLRGYRFDSGYEDAFKFIPPNTRELSATLDRYGIEHTFEEYNGDHGNRLWGRTGRLYNEVLPYFSLLLDSQ